MGWDASDRRGWTEGAIERPWDGFELCYECDGAKRCSEENPPYCKGWCHVCGGAGQWPLDPATRYFAPSPPQINLAYRARVRAKLTKR